MKIAHGAFRMNFNSYSMCRAELKQGVLFISFAIVKIMLCPQWLEQIKVTWKYIAAETIPAKYIQVRYFTVEWQAHTNVICNSN